MKYVQQCGSTVVNRQREQDSDGDADESGDVNDWQLPTEIVHLHDAVDEEESKRHVHDVT